MSTTPRPGERRPPTRLHAFVDRAARGWPYLEGADHPARVLAALVARGRRRIRISGEFAVDLDPATAGRVTSLLRLVYHGATFSDHPDPDRQEWAYSASEGTVTTPSGIRVYLDGVEPLVLAETFLYQTHFAGADLTGRIVLDAGAYVGDTALYYSSLGAEVVSYEPNPVHFERFQRNLVLNPELARRIRAFPEAIGPDGTFAFARTDSAEGSLRALGTGPVRVTSRSLASVFDRSGSPEFWLAKFDLKGEEFYVAREPSVGRIDRLQVEYTVSHPGGDLPLLLGLLRDRGFAIERVYKHNYLRFRLREHGTIQARNRRSIASRAT
jgi:FkbM family methyltransferase